MMGDSTRYKWVHYLNLTPLLCHQRTNAMQTDERLVDHDLS